MPLANTTPFDPVSSISMNLCPQRHSLNSYSKFFKYIFWLVFVNVHKALSFGGNLLFLNLYFNIIKAKEDVNSRRSPKVIR